MHYSDENSETVKINAIKINLKGLLVYVLRTFALVIL